MSIIEGNFQTPTGRFALLAARFNYFIVEHLVNGAKDALTRHGVSEDNIDVVLVPGSFELPLIARKVVESNQYTAVICLGCVIRGETGHYDYVAGESAKGIAQASLSTGVPIIFGVLTCDTLDQAINRAGAKAGNKGFDAGMTAIEMVNLIEQLPNSDS